MCVDCPQGCFQCSKSLVTGNVNCEECYGGYYLTYSSQSQGQICSSCDIDGCTTCQLVNNKPTCTFCDYFSSLNNGTCLQCGTHCSVCTPSNDGPVCSSCLLGFGVVNGSCVSCSEGCSACSSSTTCTTCYDGYYLIAKNNTCKPCNSLTAGCGLCTNITCNACQPGFFLTGDGTCQGCA